MPLNAPERTWYLFLVFTAIAFVLATGAGSIIASHVNDTGFWIVKESFGLSQLVLVVGILQEKDAREILATLHREYQDLVEDICFTQSTSPRAIPAGQLAELALDVGFHEQDMHITERLAEAIDWAVGRLDASPDGAAGGVLITGSITVVGEARTLLGGGDI